MITIRAEDFLAYAKENFDAPAEEWAKLIPSGQLLDLNDFLQAPDQIWPDFDSLLPDPDRNLLLNIWATLRAQPDPTSTKPFMDLRDPPREETVNPLPSGSPIRPPKGAPTVAVGGVLYPRADKWSLAHARQYKGPQVYVQRLASVDTSRWVVTGGKVRFLLMEGQNAWGPWKNVHPAFDLGVNDPTVALRFNATVVQPLSYWMLMATALEVTSSFTATPFKW